jgi:hypothetical protein
MASRTLTERQEIIGLLAVSLRLEVLALVALRHDHPDGRALLRDRPEVKVAVLDAGNEGI